MSGCEPAPLPGEVGRVNRRLASAVVGMALLIVGAGACGDDSTPVETGATTPTSAGPVSATTSAPVTVASTTPPATTPPPPTTDVPPGPAGRTVVLGQAFVVDVGESVIVAGVGLTVTYVELVTDSRCPPDVQCIWAGNATIAVRLSAAGEAPATVPLSTMEGPTSAGYASFTVALVDLAWGPSPTARLRVT
jgi:hypothetical protein